MKRVVHALCLAVLLTAASAAPAADPTTTRPTTAPAAARPNVIFILADDLGYGDLGVTFQNARGPGQPHFATPDLDALAASGTRLDQHYSGSPVCAPARGSLLLGQHSGTCPIRDNQFDKAVPNVHTLATVLKAAGYHTAAIGKWGLQGEGPDYPGHPLRHGFDEFFGFLAHVSGHVYYHDAAHPLHEGFTDVTAHYVDVYSTDLFTARAKRFIVDHHAAAPAQPFFLFLAYTAPHNDQEVPGNAYPAGGGLAGGLQWPLAATPATRDAWYDPVTVAAKLPKGGPWPDRAKRYVTVIRRMDQGVGDIVHLLRDLKIDRDTLIVFTSDNGPSNEGIDPRRFDSWGPFDGFKRDVWEGGVREPTIVTWPGHVLAGRVSPLVSAFCDWMPTLADVAGLVPPAQTDGVSLLPDLTGSPGQRIGGYVYEDYSFDSPPTVKGPLADVYRRKHVTGRGVQQMLREGDLAAVRTQVKSAADPLRLYDVVTDPHEDHDLAADSKYAGLLARMRSRMTAIHRPDPQAKRPYDDDPIPAVPRPAGAVAGRVDATVFAGRWPWMPDLDAIPPGRPATVRGTDLAGLDLPPDGAVRLAGYVTVPADGSYTFWLTGTGGGELWLHDGHLIDDDFTHADGRPSMASVPLRAGCHPFHLSCRFTRGSPPAIRLEIAGPGLPRQAIPTDLLSSEPLK